jgi:hypothetical protein
MIYIRLATVSLSEALLPPLDIISEIILLRSYKPFVPVNLAAKAPIAVLGFCISIDKPLASLYSSGS